MNGKYLSQAVKILVLVSLAGVSVTAEANPPSRPPSGYNDAGVQLNRTREYIEREQIARRIQEERNKQQSEVEAEKGSEQGEASGSVLFLLQKVVIDDSQVLSQAEIASVTVIYVDTLFLLNTMVDYLLLLASARLAGEPLARLRFALGAVLGGLYAVAIFLPGMGFLARPLCRGAAAVLMVLLAFWRSRRLLRQVLIFLALACAFGGGVLAVELLGGQRLALGGGVLYSGMDLKIVLLSAAGCYGLLTLVFRGIGRHGGPSGELTRVRLTLGERQVELTGLVDTGNTLTDPATGRPVLVAEADSLEELLPPGLRPGPAELRDPAGVLERLEDGPWRLRFRLLPYRAVGVERGLLLALRMDRVQVGEEDRGPMLAALSPTPVSDGGAYRVLVGAE